jgi:small-conductance mechanosensitive channel
VRGVPGKFATEVAARRLAAALAAPGRPTVRAAMDEWLRLVGPQRAVELFGVRLVGINADNGVKLLFTLAFIVAVWLTGRALQALLRRAVRERDNRQRAAFWGRQSINLGVAIVLLLGIASIWFDDPTRLTTALGLVTAGLAFALQKVITALAGYFVILRGKIFDVGDRIVMGGVRGDVIALDFTQTTIMEMGQPPAVQGADPAMWLHSREYSGRVVSVTNARIFDEPIYNYTREFPYIWEELIVPFKYDADHRRAEQILLDAAAHYTVSTSELGADALQEMQRRYVMKPTDLRPKVYYRLTDNWVELTLRFIVKDHAIREVKDALSREVLRSLDAAGIGIASTTLEIAALPPLRIDGATPTGRRPHG